MTAKAYGPVPPDAVSVCEYAVPAVPLGSVLGASVTTTAALIAGLYDCTPVTPFASVAVMSRLLLPAALGVPLSTPALVSVRPAGKAPEVTAKAYGPVPPDAVNVCAYAVPAVPAGSVPGASVTTTAALMVGLYDRTPVTPFASVAVMSKLLLTALLGVPLSTPARDSDKPAGNAPEVTAKAYGPVPPDAVRVCEYAAPVVPLGSVLGASVTTTAALIAGLYDRTPLTPFASVAVISKLLLPVALGVPLSTPVLDSVSPAGSDPLVTAKVYGPVPPDAVSVCE